MLPRFGIVAVLASTLLLSACSAAAPTPLQTAIGAPPSPTPASQPTVASPAAVSSPSPQTNPTVQLALSQAASRLGVSQADLRVERVEAREWPDASLGCPQPGVLYAQVLTPGFLVVVSAAGKQLEYHTDQQSKVVLCQER